MLFLIVYQVVYLLITLVVKNSNYAWIVEADFELADIRHSAFIGAISIIYMLQNERMSTLKEEIHKLKTKIG